MWFEREAKIVQEAIENTVRGWAGARLIAAVLGTVALAGVVTFSLPALKTLWSSAAGLWDRRLNTAVTYVQSVATDEFLARYEEIKQSSYGGIATIKQTAKFDVSTCTLYLEQVQLGQLHFYSNQKLSKISDETQQIWVRLGSLEALEIRPGVETSLFNNMRTIETSPNAYRIFVVTKENMRTKVTDKMGGGPSDFAHNTEKFHIISTGPIQLFVDRLLYLDRHCGNTATIEPRITTN